ncbi:HNH endonuclease [Microbacterium sp. AG238]|uniref:HNH endonuclease n=1 Tax=Microbacterium sp. AG238 TaxID=2183994 RepID=UPI000FF1724A|nr:HNH endonuclease [Microbacterium sp. AG238]RKE60450.1 HNH endonuclease [Microbacterium sp. AG238]
MSSRSVRDGKGHRAYRRKQAALKRRTARENLPCGYGSPTREGCGQPIDTTLPKSERMSFTADHPEALENGGHLTRQDLVPMHRSCNSRKGDNAPIDISAFAAS